MTAVTRRQEEKWRNVRMPIGKSIRTPARPAPPCGRASSIALPRRIELQKKGPKQRQARSGQVTHRGQSGAWGKKLQGNRPSPVVRRARADAAHRARVDRSCCDAVAVDGGDCSHPPQQPCGRSLHQTGRFRLPGRQGLEGARPPGRRRAKARWVRGEHSFGGLGNHDQRSCNILWPVDTSWPVAREPFQRLVDTTNSNIRAKANFRNAFSVVKQSRRHGGLGKASCLAIGFNDAIKGS